MHFNTFPRTSPLAQLLVTVTTSQPQSSLSAVDSAVHCVTGIGESHWSGTNTPPDESGQNYLLASERSVNCALTLSRKCLVDTLKNSSYSPFEIHICCGKQLPKQPDSSPTFGSSYELQTIWTENNYKSN